jgi:hypothetical protein
MELSEGAGNQDVGGGGECGKDGMLYICKGYPVSSTNVNM